MPRTKEQFEEIRQNRRDQILESALEIFASEGYHSASISKIAQHAGISKGLMYNYFSSKEMLLQEVLMKGVQNMKDVFKFMKDDMDTPEELMILIKGTIEMMQEDPHYYKLYFTLFFQPAAYSIVRSKYTEILGSLLNDIAYYFEKKGDEHPLEKAMVLAALLDGIGLHYLMAPDMYDLEVFEKIIFELFK